MSQDLIERTLLFEFSIDLKPVVHRTSPPASRTAKRASRREAAENQSKFGWELDESHRLPHFAALGGYGTHTNVYAGWSQEGLYFQAIVQGKSSLPRRSESEWEHSDGLRVWIDTRSSTGIHRATRFCHGFYFYPGQPGGTASPSKLLRPNGLLFPIPRCRESPVPVEPNLIQVDSQFRPDGYTLWSHVPAGCLTGFSPDEFDAISLFYELVDSELGTQSMSLGPTLRYIEDPSLWIKTRLNAR